MNIPNTCTDYRSRQVTVPQEVIEHIRTRHPEMEPHSGKLCEVLRNPDFVYFRERTNSYLFYKLRVLSGRIANNYMVVIVQYNRDDEGLLKTAYSTGRPAYGDSLVYATRGR